MSRDPSPDMPPELRDALKNAPTDGAPDPEGADYDDLWALLDAGKPPSSAVPNAEDTWRDVQAHLDATGEARTDPTTARRQRPAHPPRSRRSDRPNWAWSTAAIVVLLVAVGAWLWSQPVSVTASPGSTLTYTLPDGSSVELNGGARLTYPRSLATISLLEDDRRSVVLQGEAYFEVESLRRPFVVNTTSAEVEVLGTAFSVRTDRASRTHVALAEGRVQVKGRTGAGSPVTLLPGQAVRVEASGAVSPPADTSLERVTAWRYGGFAATAQPLPAILEALEQQFGAPIQLGASVPRDARSRPLTLYYSNEVGVETVLHDISMARGLSYRPTSDGGYVLSAGGGR